MKILVFTDLHYYNGADPKFDTTKKLVQYAEPVLDELIKKAEIYDVDFVVNMGDSIQDENDKENDLKSLKYIFNKFKGFNCPCYSVLGNHDMKMMNSKKEIEDILGYETNYSFDKDGFHFVFFTTDVNPEMNYKRGGIYRTWILPENTLKWLENDLNNNELPCIIFTHFALPDDESIEDECLFLKNRAEVKSILAGYSNIKAVFNGHQHVSKVYEEAGITYHLIGSPISCDPDIEGMPCGVYALIEIDENNVSVSLENVLL